jgi:aminopeptidase N
MIRQCALGLALAGSIWTAAAAPAGTATAGGVPISKFTPLQPDLDYHSFANIDQFRVTRLELELRVDDASQIISGEVAMQVKRLDPGATELILDTRDIAVGEVTQKAQDVVGATSKSETTWVTRPYHFEKKDPILGQALVIELPPSKRPTEFIRIQYETSPSATALQWVSAKQTHHKPVLYTLSEPIGARSWIPLQDTPQVRMPYKAVIHTSPDAIAVMSARSVRTDDLGHPLKHRGDYTFDMPEAVPSYLIALAVGDFAFQATGPRTGVYALKPQLKEAVKEFSDAPAMLATAEQLCGPYRWERYDILVMPPSFPVGGMENPRLTFVSPTVITGDNGRISAMAHEVAHSWAGDLAGNATWRDLWLDEGIAGYLQSRIMDASHAGRRATMEEVLALKSLRDELIELKPADQELAVDLRNRDPEEAFNGVPHEKGRLLFEWLDAKFGSERLGAFLRGYFDHFEFKGVTTEEFLAYLKVNLLDRDPGIVTPSQVEAWVSGPGIPSDAVLPVSDAFAPLDEARSAWLAGRVSAKQLAARDWTTLDWGYFLDQLPATLTAAQMSELDQTFNFTRGANAEIGRGWFALVIRTRYQPAYVGLEEYLQIIGRTKFILPLYEALLKTPSGSAQAKRVYKSARAGYHPLTTAALDAILGAPPDDDENSNE